MIETASSSPETLLLRVENLTAPTFENPVSERGHVPSDSGPVFSDLSFSVSSGDVLVVQGPSGSGKSVLLKCLAHLLIFPSGYLYFQGKEMEEVSATYWRSRILYLPQRPALLPDTPRRFFETVSSYGSRSDLSKHKQTKEPGRNPIKTDPFRIAENWGIESSKWDLSWNQLSGGEAQRIALAVGLALGPDILLLDGRHKFCHAIHLSFIMYCSIA